MKQTQGRKLSSFSPCAAPRSRVCANRGFPYPRVLLCFCFIASCVSASEAWAIKEDGLKVGLTALEAILTGNFTRLIVICGSLWGAYKAYAKSSPMLLGGSVAIGLGINFLMSWVNSTWAVTV